MELAIIVAVVVVALVFDYTNGFHDAANAVATSVSTRALTPRVALLMAASMNFIGAFLGERVAETVAEVIRFDASMLAGDASSSATVQALAIVLCGLLGAIAWNLVTWYFGIPSSSSHALIGGLGGAALAGGVAVDWDVVLGKVVLPTLVSPIVAFLLAWVVMQTIVAAFRGVAPGRANRNFRILQTISAAAMALGHGLQDAQKTMGVIFLALVAGGYASRGDGIPAWVAIAAALAISVGTYVGGWRIVRTLGRRLIDLDPPRGFAAESVAAGVLYVAAASSAPISTTQTITAAITGVGASHRVSAVRWRVVRRVAAAWVLTFPAAALFAAACYGVAHLAI